MRLAKLAADHGCQGLMVLPPYVYSTDWREMKAHLVAVLRATPLSGMLYNNPIAYKTDFLPQQIAKLANEHPNLAAVKESSADVRRVTALRAILGERLRILVGVDDMIVEGVAAGAVGWIAGLVNAFPGESVALFKAAQRGPSEALFKLYSWFLPLLRLDVVPKFVQMIKLVQAAVGMGHPRVRPPRLELAGEELRDTQAVIQTATARRETLGQSPPRRGCWAVATEILYWEGTSSFPINGRTGMRKYTLGMAALALAVVLGNVSVSDSQGQTALARKATRTNSRAPGWRCPEKSWGNLSLKRLSKKWR